MLRLLWMLQQLSCHLAALEPADEPASIGAGPGAADPAQNWSAFLNRKLNAKLLRQLQDPLALCSRSLPPWCGALAAHAPFLFSFESRRLHLHSTAFGLSRALQRLQQHSADGAAAAPNGAADRSSSSDSRLGRLPRQKVRISRTRILDSALKVMDLYAAHKALLEVEYFSEVGTGLGPTLEFYSLVSLELRRTELRLWLDDGPPPSEPKAEAEGGAVTIREGGEAARHVYAACGLYPRPVQQGGPSGASVPPRTLQLFGFCGKFVAKAMLDNRLVDLPFCPTFYRQLAGEALGLADLALINRPLAATLRKLQSLARRRAEVVGGGGRPAEVAATLGALTYDGCDVSDLGLDFTLPGHPEVELLPGGAAKDLTLENAGEYVQRVLDVYLREGVAAQVAAFRDGFSSVFPVDSLAAFSPAELDVLLNGETRERWEVHTVIDHLKYDHGYTRSSRAVGFLLQLLSEMDDTTISEFLKFVTGSPRLPVGGLARLSPRLTIVLKKPEDGVSPDTYLPSVMTCANYLKLPDYSSKEIMAERLLTAIHEGQGAFLLS
jgi:E3 ubiquitin-protein ligase TRIP12